MLDGMIALAAGQATARGEILNDLPDRISDIVIFVGVAHSGWMNPILGYWAAIFAVLTAYVGIFGQAIGGQREFSGWMSKPWRMVALQIGAWTTLVCWWWNDQLIRLQGLTIFDWICQNDVAADRAPRSRFSRLPLDRSFLAHRRRSIARSPQMGIQERDSLNVANLLLVADYGVTGIAGRFCGSNSNHRWCYVVGDFWI